MTANLISDETLEQTKAWSTAALSAMELFNVPPTSQNYSLWYEYHSGRDISLKRALDDVIARGGKFTEEMNHHFYERFFTAGKQEAAVRETATTVRDQIKQMRGVISDAGLDASNYGKVLEEFTGQLKTGDSPERIANLVEKVLNTTHKMEQSNRQIEHRLEASAQEIESLRRKLEEIEREAITDPTTGLANRKYFDLCLADAAKLATETGEPLSVLRLGIDNYRDFVNTWGPSLGDQALKVVAKAVTESLKPKDLPARFNIEDIVVLLPQTKLPNAISISHIIREGLRTKKLVRRSNNQDLGRITVSVGAAQFEPGKPLSDCLRRAEEALQTARHQGKNRIVTEKSLETLVVVDH